MKVLFVVISILSYQLSSAATVPEVINSIAKRFSTSQVCQGDVLTHGKPKCTRESLTACATQNIEILGATEDGTRVVVFPDMESKSKNERVEVYAEGFSSCLLYSKAVLMVPIAKWID